MAWKVVGNRDYPVNDLREHSVAECWCDPFDDEGLVVHNAVSGFSLGLSALAQSPEVFNYAFN
jgi:hypothetical protein